jgi:AAA+ ATPase superfamily predicted ATPase
MVGRIDELAILNSCLTSDKSEFIALYGRRRVGKTYLIRTMFQNKMLFQLTGLANANMQQQLINFKIAFQDQFTEREDISPKNWLEAFQLIKKKITSSKDKKKIIFIDELPWLDSTNSYFVQALEHFWNSWASNRKDVFLIVCGSAASWMIQKVINNKGGLHNRLTHLLKIYPFTLKECKLYAENKNLGLNEYQLIQLYMVLGGIPYYWDHVKKGQSASEVINELCFSTNGILKTEFKLIYKSLFNKYDKHEQIVKTLATKTKGLTRDEIIKATKMVNGGSITRLLFELEESGFIRKYVPFEKKNRNSLYQLADFYSLFYLKFIQNENTFSKNHWLKLIDSPKHRTWSGYSFEQLCLCHTDEIKKELGISGIETRVSSWKSFETGTQIDLLIERRDQAINLCEIKFSINEFCINKKYDQELRTKLSNFRSETKTKKAVMLTFISTYGLKKNEYSGNVHKELKMGMFFE